MSSKQPVTSFWLTAWAISLSMGWMIPNHYPPWSTFHVDAWSAMITMVMSGALLLRSKVSSPWHGLALTAGVAVVLPGLQYAGGLVTVGGNAWVCTAYLLGLLLAILTGSRWEQASKGQLADGIFLATGIAGLFSVGLQLHQWLLLDRLDIWSMGEGYGRPFANFGQPNQLGTFLVWSLLAIGWGFVRQKIGAVVAILAACYLLFGLSLTASRTSWLAVIILVAFSWIWRRRWADSRLPLTVSLLAILFFGFTASVGWLSEQLVGGVSAALDASRIAGEQRPAVWRLFFEAVTLKPWFGYGMNQVGYAQLAVALNHPPLRPLFSQSHNIFLDFVLWFGIPIGLAISAVLVRWFWVRIRRVATEADAIQMLFLLVIANHAMLELPLHYAHFLLPVGLMMGALEIRLGNAPIFVMARRWTAVVWFSAAILLATIIRDYMLVEPAYQRLRLQWAQVKIGPVEPPKVVLLTQWRDFIYLVNFEPTQGMTEAKVQTIRNLAGVYPSTGFVQKLATALALNSQPDEAALWLRKVCQIVSEGQCEALKNSWAQQAAAQPLIATVPWPR